MVTTTDNVGDEDHKVESTSSDAKKSNSRRVSLQGQVIARPTPSVNGPRLSPTAYSRIQLARIESQLHKDIMAARIRAITSVQNTSMYQPILPPQRNQLSSVTRPYTEARDERNSLSSRSVSPSHGLALLGALSETVSAKMDTRESREASESSSKARASAENCVKGQSSKSSSTQSTYTEVRKDDVLCGRGGKTNHHPGNKRYRQVIRDMRDMYRKTDNKATKTDVSRAIVEHVCSYGGRFLKKDELDQYYVLSNAEARKKTSQALRETKDLKWI